MASINIRIQIPNKTTFTDYVDSPVERCILYNSDVEWTLSENTNFGEGNVIIDGCHINLISSGDCVFYRHDSSFSTNLYLINSYWNGFTDIHTYCDVTLTNGTFENFEECSYFIKNTYLNNKLVISNGTFRNCSISTNFIQWKTQWKFNVSNTTFDSCSIEGCVFYLIFAEDPSNFIDDIDTFNTSFINSNVTKYNEIRYKTPCSLPRFSHDNSYVLLYRLSLWMI